jgi:hypothetical protein
MSQIDLSQLPAIPPVAPIWLPFQDHISETSCRPGVTSFPAALAVRPDASANRTERRSDACQMIG